MNTLCYFVVFHPLPPLRCLFSFSIDPKKVSVPKSLRASGNRKREQRIKKSGHFLYGVLGKINAGNPRPAPGDRCFATSTKLPGVMGNNSDVAPLARRERPGGRSESIRWRVFRTNQFKIEGLNPAVTADKTKKGHPEKGGPFLFYSARPEG
ncbi:MAG: hypothetical protein ACQESY_09025, partial [Pseudomonadota bacterium]